MPTIDLMKDVGPAVLEWIVAITYIADTLLLSLELERHPVTAADSSGNRSFG